MAFYAAGSTKARLLDRCADRRLHFGNKKTFLLHARAPHPGSSVRWWISLSTRLDISTLKSFEARHIIYLTKLAVSIRYDSTGTLSNITETFCYFISLCVALFFLSCMTYIYDVYMAFLFFYRLFLCCIQQLGQTSRWHFYISWFSQTIPSKYRLPSVHIHWSCRWNCCSNVSSIQHSSHLAWVSDLYISEE